ncbi:MAG: hypothetical protein CVU54_10340 [Deltaproteobacteria bacterium HGW-Deltaproteobacteria-12]|jgi:hypothetical protein|nr:MAG: hypothetical protein CVU54_10340 [Deltaproteobacteria bacterium HGW-Deltaproteobacteria-12]
MFYHPPKIVYIKQNCLILNYFIVIEDLPFALQPFFLFPDSQVQALREPLNLSLDCKVSRNSRNVNSVETSFCPGNIPILFFPAPYIAVSTGMEICGPKMPHSLPDSSHKKRAGKTGPFFTLA